jgi:hypothetical protein
MFRITYLCKRTNEPHTVEWVAGKFWTLDSIRECFEQRYPTAEILTIQRVPC